MTIKTRVPLAIDISVQRLNIYGALLILRWIMSLFEHINDYVFLLCEYIYSVYFVLFSAIIALISANLNSVPIFNWEKFKDGKENIKIILDYMDLDLALRKETTFSYRI